MPSKNCPGCGAEFFGTVHDGTVNFAKRKFCSLTCKRLNAPATSLESRFWPKVEKSAGGCWTWTGSRNEYGYGQLHLGGRGGSLLRAHRISWEMHFGPIPHGVLVLHRCDNPPCVRPDHLFLGTHKDNGADMARKGRAWRPQGWNGPAHNRFNSKGAC